MPSQQQNEWIKSVFGFDPISYETPAGRGTERQTRPEARNGAAKAGKTSLFSRLKSAVSKGDGAASATVGATSATTQNTTPPVEDGEFGAAMKRLDTATKSVKDAGLDAGAYMAQAKNIRDAYADAQKQSGTDKTNALQTCTDRAKAAADLAVVDVEKLKKSAVEGVTDAIKAMRDEASAQIQNIDEKNRKKAGMVKELATLDKTILDAGKLTDRAQRAKTLKTIDAAAQALFDKAAKITGDTEKIQETYAKALEKKYGIAIKNPEGMKNTHLEQVYKLFDSVPQGDVAQSMLKQLAYEPTMLNEKGEEVKNTGASYGSASINMGDYGTEDWEYVDPKDPKGKKKVQANGFNISTLHELGHSVDDRFKIMDNNEAKSGSGGWKNETLDSTAAAFVGQFKSGDLKKLSKPIDDNDLSTAIKGALGGASARPAGMTDPDWAILESTLKICLSRRSDKWPWGTGSNHDIGGRSYHEAYANFWVSFDTGMRSKPLTVRDYQWRAPGEWFAELYAFSFYKKQKPPSGVDAALAAYMFGGAQAEKGKTK